MTARLPSSTSLNLVKQCQLDIICPSNFEGPRSPYLYYLKPQGFTVYYESMSLIVYSTTVYMSQIATLSVPMLAPRRLSKAETS